MFKKAQQRKKQRLENKREKAALEADVKKTQSATEVKLAELSTKKAEAQALVDTKEQEESSKRTKTIIIYSVIGVVLLGIIITVAVYLIKKRKKG